MSLTDSISRHLTFFRQPSRQAEISANLDKELFMKVCKALYQEAPKGAEILFMKAKLPLEDDMEHREMSCHAMKSNGRKSKFTPSPEGVMDLFELLEELRDSMERQNLPAWKGFKITVDVPKDKYNADFDY